MGSYDKNPTEYQMLQYGARGLYEIAKEGYHAIKNGVKRVAQYVTPKSDDVPVGKPRTQNLEVVKPKSSAQKNEEYRQDMNKQYGDKFYNNVAGIFGFPNSR